MCVEDVEVEVHVQHSCAKELVVSLMGPGDRLGSDTDMRVETVLFSRQDSVGIGTCGEGLHGTRFDDHADVAIYECCHAPFVGRFRPWESMRKYHGHEVKGTWTLKLYDAVDNENEGSLVSWKLHFKLLPCEPKVRWRQLPSGPPARHSHTAAVVDGAMFVHGGYDFQYLQDMWRFDFGDEAWTQLSSVPHEPSRLSGVSSLMTPWGILRFGGYDVSRSSFDRKVRLYDVVEKTTRVLTTSGQEGLPKLPTHRSMDDDMPRIHDPIPAPRNWHSAIVYDSATVKSGRHSTVKVNFHDSIRITNSSGYCKNGHFRWL